MPASRPRVYTLVAMNVFVCAFNSASSSPATASALPYIEELSITEPPAANKAANTLVELPVDGAFASYIEAGIGPAADDR